MASRSSGTLHAKEHERHLTTQSRGHGTSATLEAGCRITLREPVSSANVLRIMLRHRLGHKFALLAIVCTLGIFLFPAASGPYPSVHGPVSALRAMRAWILLLTAMTLAFADIAARPKVGSWIVLPFLLASSRLRPHPQSSVLRC